MPYQPIENYGVIGNLRTAALIGLDGSIDWLCLPRFDSPSVFGAILDDNKGGRFRIAPCIEGARQKQFYWPESNVLVTRFLHPDGILELIDFMPVPQPGDEVEHQIIRKVHVVQGKLPIRVECWPAFDYARTEHTTEPDDCGVRFEGGGLCLTLASPVGLRVEDGGAVGEFTLGAGEDRTFVLQVVPPGTRSKGCPTAAGSEMMFRRTVDYWQRWLSKCTYTGRWREQVCRSALALKLLIYEPTGAIVAALTTSLPEGVGGVRNWDYRFTWIRDASFTVYALLRIGFTDEAVKFMDWLRDRWQEPDPQGAGPLQLMYGIDGRSDLEEFELPHLEGYRGSKPVRVGNGAHGQLQMDIYGGLMDSVYLFNKYASPIGYDDWTRLRRMVDWVCDNWQRADEGIWEVRGGRRDFVYSRVLCWVALDRGVAAGREAVAAGRHRKVAESPRYDSRRSDDERLECGEAIVRAELWLGHAGRFATAAAAGVLHGTERPAHAQHAGRDSRAGARRRLAADGLVYRYDPELAPDGLPARWARSTCARSG